MLLSGQQMAIRVDTLHVPAQLIWDYSQDREVLISAHLNHLKACEDCVAILWVCQTSQSFQQCKTKLSEHGFTAEINSRAHARPL